ncbi:ATP-sensitive inward rectifier potassium channel 8-like [Culex pipiens pallens]|uniref:ATP-sensitive inward rectifier potassium channel 8-like n=1 Tax=Culex pipiens pallens TaxID=42434 RepID=UPI001952EAC1|nr:ATP-sensitive inward rectifier potassium channel 8-like [Culex pipiens pallens]
MESRAASWKRTIDKLGERNVQFLNLPQRSLKFLKDLVNTLVEVQWRYTLAAFVLSFAVSWFFFAILWYLVAYAHGDLNFDPETGKRMGDGDQPCVAGATTFMEFLLFSIESQVSTGYGTWTPTEECAEALGLLTIQLIVGLVIDAAMVGIVYAKMVRPPKKISNMKFSKHAVVCRRDGRLCFVFRICDTKHQHAIETKINVVMLQSHRSLEGEIIEKYERHMSLENNGRVLLFWPVTVCHVIDAQSPLYDLTPKDLLESKFEIVVTLSGGTNITGQVNEARTSYMPGEILWGHRFKNIVHYDKEHGRYVATNRDMNATELVNAPSCSARKLDEVAVNVKHFLSDDQHREFEKMESLAEYHGQEDDSDSDDGILMKNMSGDSFPFMDSSANKTLP